MVSSALLLIVLLFLLSNAAVLPPGEPDSITTRRFRQVRAPLPTPDFPDIPPYAIPTGFFGQLHPDRGMGTVGTASGTGFGTGTGTAPSTCKMTETPKPTTTVTEKAALATKAFADMSKAAQETPLQQYLGNWRPDSTWKTASTSWTAGAWPTAPPELFKTCGSEQGTAYWTGNEQSKGITFKKSLMRDFVMASLDEAKEKKTILSYRGQTGWPAMGDKDAKSPSGTDCQITNSKHMTAYVSINYDFQGTHGANCHPPASNEQLTKLDMAASHDQLRSIFDDLLNGCLVDNDWSMGGSFWMNCYVFKVGVNWDGHGDVKKGGC